MATARTGRSRAFVNILSWTLLLCLPSAAVVAEPADALDLGQYRGKVVLLDFWASWCEPCRQSFPWLNEMQARYADRGLVVIGINVDSAEADARRFLRDFPAAFRIVYDPAGKLAQHYDVPGMPASYVLGRDGRIVGQHVGFRSGSRQERETELKQLLGAGPARATD